MGSGKWMIIVLAGTYSDRSCWSNFVLLVLFGCSGRTSFDLMEDSSRISFLSLSLSLLSVCLVGSGRPLGPV